MATADSAQDLLLRRLLLVGKTGVGKSKTGNNILNLKKDPFKTGFTSCPVTLAYQPYYSRYKGQPIKVGDMPGLWDSGKNKSENIKCVAEEIGKAVVETTDDYDAILVVVQLGRLTMEDKETIDTLKHVLGEMFLKEYGILVVTRGDDFKREAKGQQTFEEYCSQDNGLLNNMWEECNRRAVLFDNVTENKKERDAQRKKLFDIMDTMEKNSRYTPQMFKDAKAKRDELIDKANQLVVTDEMKSTVRLMIHDLISVELKTPGDSIAQLEEIKKTAQEFKAKTEEKTREVKKRKKVLGVIKSIEKTCTNLIELKQLMEQMAKDPVSSEESDHHKALEEKLLERMTAIVTELENLYESLTREDTSVKEIIVAFVLKNCKYAAIGACGGLAVGYNAGASGLELLDYAVRGIGTSVLGPVGERMFAWDE